MKRLKSLLRPARQLIEDRLGVHLYLTPPHGVSLTNDIKRLIPDFHADLIIDVGANVGQSAVDFRKAFPGATIHCLEPSEANYRALVKTAQRLGNAFAHNIAAGAHHGTARLVHGLDPSMHYIDLDVDDATSSEQVAIITMDEFCKSIGADRISILKVDTEGHELDVLNGARGLLSTERIDLVYLEAGMNLENLRHTYFSKIHELVSEYGYELFGFYEQMHEWISSRPLLRRANIAFLSRTLAGSMIRPS